MGPHGQLPAGLAGRVNTAINLMVFATIFVLQSLSGQVINLWSASESGAYPAEAYQAAFVMFLVLQITAFVWFVLPRRQ